MLPLPDRSAYVADWSLSTASTTLPSLILPPPPPGPPWQPAASSAPAATTAAALVVFMGCSLDSEVFEEFVLAGADLCVVEGLGDAALGEQVVAGGGRGGGVDRLVRGQT